MQLNMVMQANFQEFPIYKKDNHIYIEVEDHGAGISEKDKIHIFTRAYTADRKKGNGLGLAISQELANSMGGSISVVSIPQEKTVFTTDCKVRKKLELKEKKDNFLLYTVFQEGGHMMNYAIETHHLKKVYKDKIVVNDVNIHVKKGEIYGFVGPNGAGKSTLMKMLLNLVQANSGEIVIFRQ